MQAEVEVAFGGILVLESLYTLCIGSAKEKDVG